MAFFGCSVQGVEAVAQIDLTFSVQFSSESFAIDICSLANRSQLLVKSMFNAFDNAFCNTIAQTSYFSQLVKIAT